MQVNARCQAAANANVVNTKSLILYSCSRRLQFNSLWPKVLCETTYLESSSTTTISAWKMSWWLCQTESVAKTMHTQVFRAKYFEIKNRAFSFHLFLNGINLEEKRCSIEEEEN